VSRGIEGLFCAKKSGGDAEICEVEDGDVRRGHGNAFGLVK
jgi:hypothetical protein